ncbi:hypothetical protein OJAV_G00062610 [Oryzias javanicus]|uniref:Uncharacterized protein n=1 Tax=Oryzias javanicus TaxID=123683 RepID=A0A3S2UG67_ORYJA|nr:hypothetical protein OJAV_G00062610 [Oryzias javanicus]
MTFGNTKTQIRTNTREGGKSRDPLLLSASLNSPLLIQLSGRRDSACSDSLTWPPSLCGSPSPWGLPPFHSLPPDWIHPQNALLKLVKWNQINCSMDLVPFNQL